MERGGAMATRINRRRFAQLGSLAVMTVASRRLPASTGSDVLVIGAGALGCNAAWHLREMGHTVTVLEANAAPAQQASGAAAGFVANWSGLHVSQWGVTERKMQAYGIHFYTALAARTRDDIGFRKNGICYVFTNATGWQDAQARIATGLALNIPFEILDKKRVAELLPLINFSATSGIVYDPTSVRVRAADTIPFLARDAETRGVRFLFDTHVESFLRSGSRVTGVKTSKGDFEADNVLITAGAWSLGFLDKVGVKPPVQPLIEARYTTKPMPEVPPNLPLLIFSDVGFYIREERGGLLIGGGESKNDADRQVDRMNPPTSDHLNLGEIQRIQKHLSVITDTMPILTKTGVDQIKAGIPTFTKDVHFVADRVSGTNNLYVITACQEAGITHGPALGRMMAELISSGHTSLDRSAFRLDRFKA
jgi:sarcosine oxidase, subunit beta